MTQKLAIIIGSLRKDSYTRQVAQAFISRLPQEYEARIIKIDDLPYYNEDLESDGLVPESWTRFRQELTEVTGVLFFTPEYNRSIPATIKNALDVGSRPYGASIWEEKPALVVSVSPGAISGFGANHVLRQSLVFLNMPTLQQPEAYIGHVPNLLADNGEFTDKTTNFFQTILDKYLEFLVKNS
ncbi:MAG: NADPH-dependent FMN reductase [Enterococcus sp.]